MTRPRNARRRRRRRSISSPPTSMPMEAGHGGTDLSRCRRARHRAGNDARSRRRVPRRGHRQGRRRVQDDGRTLRAIRAAARARHPDLRTGDPRRRHGCGDDRPEADRRNHVLGFHRGLFRLHRQRIPEEPLHEQRPAQMPAGRAHRQRRGLTVRRATLTERRELVHDDSGSQGGGAVDPARCDRIDGGGGARSGSGDLLRAQVALRDEGRGARRRDRRHAGQRQDRAARARTRPFWRWL